MTNPSSSKMASPRAPSPCSESERAYRATCTLPPMPKKCPECTGKVKLCHINDESNDAMFMCADTKCDWPFNCGKKPEEFSGFSDVKLYQKWQEEQKKKKRRNKEVLSSRRASSVTSGEDDANPHSDKDNPSRHEVKSGMNVDKSHVSSVFDVQGEADSGPSKKESKKHGEARETEDAKMKSSDEKAAVPDISREAKSSTSPIAGDERDTFLLPEKPASEMTPRRKDNNFSASDNEDYGEISDAEVDFNIFRYNNDTESANAPLMHGGPKISRE